MSNLGIASRRRRMSIDMAWPCPMYNSPKPEVMLPQRGPRHRKAKRKKR
jgi:hypothetical protein